MQIQNSVGQELEAYSSSDAVANDVLQRAWTAITQSEAMATLDELHLFVINPDVASRELLASEYYTDNLLAMRNRKAIIVNERFLLSVEMAVRSFAQSASLLKSPYLREDQQLFGLVRRTAEDFKRTLRRLRQYPQNPGAMMDQEEAIRQEMTMVALFFLAHEFGHLVGGHAIGQFSTFVDPHLPVERRIDAAVVRLCRHVDEFAKYKFSLPGFKQVEKTDSEQRRVAKQFQDRNKNLYDREEVFFRNEAEADDVANRLMAEYLTKLGGSNDDERQRSLYLLVCGIFSVSLYMWYRDLDAFMQAIGLVALSQSQFQLLMMEDRQRYVNAASLFGTHHRFTLLRAALATEAIMRSQTMWFDLPPEKRSIHTEVQPATIADDAIARSEWWLSECLQRYSLLCICMDTAVKIAYMGCSTGWIRDIEARQGPKLFMMNFEPINKSVNMLMRIR